MSTPQHYLLLSGILFAIGVAVVVARRHRLVKLLGLELLLQAANLAWGALASGFQDWEGRIATLTMIAIAVVELVVGLAVLIAYRQKTTSRGSPI